MHVETVVAGFGGQGILFLGRVLATAGMIEGFHAVSYTHLTLPTIYSV